MTMTFWIYFAIILHFAVYAERCWDDNENTFKFCDEGCCTLSNGDAGCCTDLNAYRWAIYVGIAVFIILVAVCAAIVLLCVKKNRGHRGVISPGPPMYSSTVAYYQPPYPSTAPPPYPSQPQGPYMTSSSQYGSQPQGPYMASTSQHGRPAMNQQHLDKGTLEQAEGLHGRPPPAFGLPPNHRIV